AGAGHHLDQQAQLAGDVAVRALLLDEVAGEGCVALGHSRSSCCLVILGRTPASSSRARPGIQAAFDPAPHGLRVEPAMTRSWPRQGHCQSASARVTTSRTSLLRSGLAATRAIAS